MTGPGASDSHEERAKALDRLAERILADLAPLSFEIAGSPEERDDVLRMRYGCMLELGWVTPGDYRDGRVSDEDDERATFVVCRDGDDLVGSMRVVPPVPDRPLPTEREFGIRVRPAGAIFEAGRMVVPRRHRAGRSHRIVAGFCARSWVEGRAFACNRVISAVAPDVMELYRGLGMRIVVLGPPREYWGEERAPVEITVREAQPAAVDRDTRLTAALEEPG